MLFADWEVHIVKNCDRAVRGRGPRAAFPSPRSQLFTTLIDLKPENNLFIFSCGKLPLWVPCIGPRVPFAPALLTLSLQITLHIYFISSRLFILLCMTCVMVNKAVEKIENNNNNYRQVILRNFVIELVYMPSTHHRKKNLTSERASTYSERCINEHINFTLLYVSCI